MLICVLSIDFDNADDQIQILSMQFTVRVYTENPSVSSLPLARLIASHFILHFSTYSGTLTIQAHCFSLQKDKWEMKLLEIYAGSIYSYFYHLSTLDYTTIITLLKHFMFANQLICNDDDTVGESKAHYQLHFLHLFTTSQSTHSFM